MIKPIHIVGGGMAGSEAAWQIVSAGIPVIIHEMRPSVETFAHQTHDLAELVCSNSFRSDDDESNAVGLLHWEMRSANSIIMEMGDKHALPAGSALAVDREAFSASVTKKITNHPLVTIDRSEIHNLPPENWGHTIIATGPLTSKSLANDILENTDQKSLAFFDAIAPIVFADSIDMSKAWMQSRYDKGETDEERTAYLNCPMDKETYDNFIDAFLPIEVMAERGKETLRWGPMKPVGLTNPHQPTIKAHAVVQLRRDNALGTLFNIVGFQTKMKYSEQTRVLSMIPGLENAKFARLGGIHRNTFINSPLLLDDQMRLKTRPNIRFAGQITGVEGYVESAAMGLLAGRLAVAESSGKNIKSPPNTTAMGALINHITGGADAKTFQPMNVNFGLFPPVENVKGGRRNRKDRYKAYTDRAKNDWTSWLNNT